MRRRAHRGLRAYAQPAYSATRSTRNPGHHAGPRAAAEARPRRSGTSGTEIDHYLSSYRNARRLLTPCRRITINRDPHLPAPGRGDHRHRLPPRRPRNSDRIRVRPDGRTRMKVVVWIMCGSSNRPEAARKDENARNFADLPLRSKYAEALDTSAAAICPSAGSASSGHAQTRRQRQPARHGKRFRVAERSIADLGVPALVAGPAARGASAPAFAVHLDPPAYLNAASAEGGVDVAVSIGEVLEPCPSP